MTSGLKESRIIPQIFQITSLQTEFLWGVSQCWCAVKPSAFVRKPVLYRHKAVRHPRLPPLVLVVVTATEKAWMLEKRAGFFFFFDSLQQAFSKSVEVTQFSGQQSEIATQHIQESSCYISATWICWFILKPQNMNPCVYSSVTDILCCSSLAGFSSIAIWGGEPTAALSPGTPWEYRLQK